MDDSGQTNTDLRDKLKKLPLKAIRPYARNAKIHTREQIETLKKSIQNHEYYQPICVDAKNVIVIGHGRYLAMKELDPDQEIDVVDLSYLKPKELRKLRILDNKSVSDDWDMEMLQNEIESLYGKVSDEVEKIADELGMETGLVTAMSQVIDNTPRNEQDVKSDNPLPDEELAIPPYEWLRRFDKLYLTFSGGKDSMATLATLMNNGVDMSKLELVFCRTPLDYTDLEDFVTKFAEDMKITLHKIGHEMTEEDKRIMFERNGLPKPRQNWCTGMWKILPSNRFFRERKAENITFCMIIGWRREEAQRRATSLERAIEGNHEVPIFRPILDMTQEQVFEEIKAKGWTLHHSYAYRDRLGCLFCFATTREEWVNLRKNDPKEFMRALEYLAYGCASHNMENEESRNAIRKAFGLPTVYETQKTKEEGGP